MKYLHAFYDHVERRVAIYIALAAGIAVLGHWFFVAINLTHSLPGTVFLVEKGAHPKKGELAAFVYGGGGPYPKGAYFLKILTGEPGDTVSAQDLGKGYHAFFVNGKFVGRAKPLSSTGQPLTTGPTGILPPGSYYMEGTSPDSLDSRYNWVGWVSNSQIVGRGFRVF